jgi:hypothetical protein
MSNFRAVLILAACVLTGCATWRSGSTSELKAGTDGWLIITTDHAYELAISNVRYGKDGTIRGYVKRAWLVPQAKIIHLDEIDVDPQTLADRLHWAPLERESLDVEVRVSEIRYVRAYDPRSPLTFLAVVTVLALGAAALGGAYGLAVASSAG